MSTATYPRRRIRIALDASSDAPAIDQLTGATPFFWKGTDIVFELVGCLGDLDNGGELLDVTNVSSITLSVKASTRTGSNLMSATISSTELHPLITVADWNNKTDQHIQIPFTATETLLSMSGTTELSLWCVVYVLTTDSPCRYITWGAFPIKIVEDGRTTGTAPVNDPDYYTTVESDARYPIKSDETITLTAIKLLNADTGKYHLVAVRGASGSEQLVIGPGETLS